MREFGPETLPFKRFAPNAAFYYTMLVAFSLYEAFKEDVCQAVVPIGAYATTLRRKVIDVAAKIVHKSEQIILKVTTFTRPVDHLNISKFFGKKKTPPPLSP